MTVAIRNSLCADTLISDIYHCFRKIPDPRKLSGTLSISFALPKNFDSRRVKNHVQLFSGFKQFSQWNTKVFRSTREDRVMRTYDVETQTLNERVDESLQSAERCAEYGFDH